MKTFNFNTFAVDFIKLFFGILALSNLLQFIIPLKSISILLWIGGMIVPFVIFAFIAIKFKKDTRNNYLIMYVISGSIVVWATYIGIILIGAAVAATLLTVLLNLDGFKYADEVVSDETAENTDEKTDETKKS